LFTKFIEYGLIIGLDKNENIYERKYKVLTTTSKNPKKLIARIKEKVAKKEAFKKVKIEKSTIIGKVFEDIEKIKNKDIGQKTLF